MDGPDRPARYPVRAVAERLGVPTATLRSWNQRYGIGPRGHQPGLHRHYTEADITLLRRMVELIRAGASPASAARAARAGDCPAPDAGQVAALLDAAFQLDSPALTYLLDRHFGSHGVATTWNGLCRPAFAALVARQGAGEGCVDVEHLLSWAVVTSLHRTVPPPAVAVASPILLACTAGETHTLPLEILRAVLAERGTVAQLLGATVPASALSDAVGRQAGTVTVVLWAHRPETADPDAIRALAAADATLLLAGPGWSDRHAAGRPRLHTLADAVAALGNPPH